MLFSSFQKRHSILSAKMLLTVSCVICLRSRQSFRWFQNCRGVFSAGGEPSSAINGEPLLAEPDHASKMSIIFSKFYLWQRNSMRNNELTRWRKPRSGLLIICGKLIPETCASVVQFLGVLLMLLLGVESRFFLGGFSVYYLPLPRP